MYWCNEQTNNKLKVAIVIILGGCTLISTAFILHWATRRPIEEIKALQELEMTIQQKCASIGGDWSGTFCRSASFHHNN